MRNLSPPAANEMNQVPPGNLKNLYNALPSVAVSRWTHEAFFGSSPIEFWLFDPNPASIIAQENFKFVNLSTVNPEVLSSRLQMVINTLWQSTYSISNLVGDFSAPQEPNGINVPWLNQTLAPGTRFEDEVYVCHASFVTLLLLTSLLRLGVGIVAMILKLRTLAPDILGYASTCVRDNPYCSD